MQTLGHIHVISCGVGQELCPKMLRLLKQAQRVFASKTLCAAYLTHEHGQKVYSIGAKAKDDAQKALALCREGKQVVVLASGDALYHGMGATLLQGRSTENMTFHPHTTAFQTLFHLLALPWSDVALFSVHAPHAPLPLQRMAGEPLALIYGGTQYPASRIAKALMTFQPEAKHRLAVMAECLGGAEEKIQVGTLEHLADKPCHATSMLLCLSPQHYGYLQKAGFLTQYASASDDACASSAPLAFGISAAPTVADASPISPAPILPLGLQEDFYAKENNLITAPDVRAIILARLRLPRWGLLWDLGAGSGSVGLEAAGLCPHVDVVAVEKNKERMAHIQQNAQRMGVDNYTVQHENAVDFLQNFCQRQKTQQQKGLGSLQKPDRIFIGGGGADIATMIELSLACLQEQGLLVVSAVSLESFHAINSCASEHKYALSSIQIAHEENIAGKYHHLKAQNTIYLFTFSQDKQHRERA